MISRLRHGWTTPALASAVVVILGCRDTELAGPKPDPCTGVVVSVTPDSSVLSVGDSLVLVATYTLPITTCTPTVPINALRWFSGDPSVATVDSLQGIVTARRRGEAQIVVRAPDDQRVLGHTNVTVFTPLFNRIIYTQLISPCPAGPNNCPPELWTMAPDGTDQRRLLDSLHWPEHPRVSPDGRTVAFEDWAELYLVDAAGRYLRRFETGTLGNFGPTWSPDGQTILFWGVEPGDSAVQVFAIRRDGSGLKKLTTGPLGSGMPAWSPDGQRIVFVRAVQDSSGAVSPEAVVMDSNGGNQHVLIAGTSGFRGQVPEWSPDGASIIFLDSFGSDWAIKQFSFVDSTYSMLADAQGNRNGSWSPDGQYIVYGTGDLWIMDRAGSNAHVVLSDSMVNFEAAWTPAPPLP